MTKYRIISTATGAPLPIGPFDSMTGAEMFRCFIPGPLSETEVEIIDSPEVEVQAAELEELL